MGLDMWIKKRQNSAYTQAEIDVMTNKENYKKFQESWFPKLGKNNEIISADWEKVCYWRKFNALHRWFVENLQNNKNDCGFYVLSKEKVLELKKHLKTVQTEIGKALEDFIPDSFKSEKIKNVNIWNEWKNQLIKTGRYETGIEYLKKRFETDDFYRAIQKTFENYLNAFESDMIYGILEKEPEKEDKLRWVGQYYFPTMKGSFFGPTQYNSYWLWDCINLFQEIENLLISWDDNATYVYFSSY